MEYITLPSGLEDKVFIEQYPKFLPKEELKQFMFYLEEENKTQNTCLFRLLAFTGIRKGEVLALHWSYINFVNKDLYIKKTLAKVNNKHLLQPPKTRESQRRIDIDNQTISKLLQWKEEQNFNMKNTNFQSLAIKNNLFFQLTILD